MQGTDKRKERTMHKAKFFLAAMVFCGLIVRPACAGTVTGTIKYDGEVPKFKEIKMDADPICLSHHTSPVYPENLVVGEGNTMANVFVYVKSGLPAKPYPAPKEAVTFDQNGCQYSPHVLGIMVGQPLKVLNPDGTLHNVHALCKVNEEFNLAMPKTRTEVEKVFDKPEPMFSIKCDVHPWMGAYMAVMEHPFFSTTKTDGKFTIENLEPGTYEIEAWHEKLGTKTASVTVAGPETKVVDFTFSKASK